MDAALESLADKLTTAFKSEVAAMTTKMDMDLAKLSSRVDAKVRQFTQTN